MNTQTQMKAEAETMRPRLRHGVERALPKYVTEEGNLYRVKIVRGKVRFCGSVSKGRENALQEAVAMRDQFLAAAGPVMVPMVHEVPSAARSNTGLRGISESVKWTKYRPRYCFVVGLGTGKRRVSKRVFWGPRVRTREEALRMAINLRSQISNFKGRL